MKLSDLSNSRVLVIASTGGHLAQAVQWQERLGLRSDSIFVTFDSAQSRSLLAGKPHIFVKYVPPRGVPALIAASVKIVSHVGSSHYSAILSTGAALALAGLPLALRDRKPYVYVESVSRFDGPSLTGSILARTPAIHRYTQHQAESYPEKRWQFAGCLLDDYQIDSHRAVVSEQPGLRIFVTLGTIRPYRMDRLVDGLLPALRDEDDVVWQLGQTSREDLPGTTFKDMTSAEFALNLSRADVVVTHAGVGTLLGLLDGGKQPVVMARRREFGEHVDDHQLQVVKALSERGLVAEISGPVSRDVLEAVAKSTIRSRL